MLEVHNPKIINKLIYSVILNLSIYIMENLKKKLLIITLLFLLSFRLIQAQDEKIDSMEIYGHVMTDAGYNFNQTDPNWFDVVRPSKLPSFKNEFGSDGNTYFSVRQTRFGVKNYFNIPLGQMKTIFEWELFGVGEDEGQTTFRLRHAYGELGRWGAGQYWSPFMDIDVFPNTLEYWGPNGMVFFRNVQIRYMPIKKENRIMTIALERPGASPDLGTFANRVELDSISPRFPLPDLSAEYRHGGKFGYVELAGMVRRIMWEDQNHDSIDYSGGVVGWGFNLSTNLKFGRKDVFKGQVVYGRGIENYMNDAPNDVALTDDQSSSIKAVKAIAIPVLGVVAFYDHYWSDKFSTSIGYSLVNMDNANGQDDNAFHRGHYAIVNLLYTPTDKMLVGIEYQWARRENFRDEWTSSMSKIQVSFKYFYSQFLYRKRS